MNICEYLVWRAESSPEEMTGGAGRPDRRTVALLLPKEFSALQE